MRKLYFTIFLFTLFLSDLMGCALCQLQVPTAEVYIKNINIENKNILDVTWRFGEAFTAETLISYDQNNNKIYEKNELDEIKNSLEIYLEKYSYLTSIQSYKKDKTLSKNLDFKIISSYIEYKNKSMIYHYSLELSSFFEKDKMYKLKFFDEREYFDFIVMDYKYNNEDLNEIVKNKNSIEVYYYTFEQKEEVKEEKNVNKIDEIKKEKGFLDLLKEIFEALKKYINNLLIDIKENNSLGSYILLLLFSFFYGVVHAIGPGHGKSLVSSYFLTKDGSILKALKISVMIGVVHTFSAFLLTVTIYYVLQTILSSYFKDIEFITTKVSAIIVISIAAYLLYQKTRKNEIKTFKVGSPQSFVKQTQMPSHISSSSCGCNSCKTTSTDLGVVLAAGLVPCPGTITIFIFTFGLGIYFVGFLSAVFMSLGMSFIIFTAAYLSINIKKGMNGNHKLKKFLEYISLLIIFILGFLLLL